MLAKKLCSLRLLVSTAIVIALVVPAVGVAQTSASSDPSSSALSTARPVANRLTQPINDKTLVTLKGTVHPLATAANDRGAAPDGMALDRIQIVLQRSPAQETALKQLITDLHTPGTANYHKWLTPTQFGQQFGPSDADVATISTWLASHGFGSVKVDPGKQTLEVSGSAGQFRDTFHAQIHKYVVKGETHYANATDPEIPAALAPVFGGFASLNNFRIKSNTRKLGTATYNPATHQATPQWTIGNSQGVNFVLAPADFAVQYDLNPLYTAGTNGTGQTIAIINDSNINLNLVSNFRTQFLPSYSATNLPNVIIDGNDPGIDGINNPDGPNYDSIEAYLDVEWSGAVAPDATIDLVIGADTALESGLILAAEHAVYANTAPVMSLSFGECELDLASTNQFLSALWEQAAAQGITVNVSAGDNGSAGCDNDNTQDYAIGGQAVSGFASTPYNVAVGGTDFYYSSATAVSQYWANNGTTYTASNSTPTTSLLSRIPEQPWNDSQYGLDQTSIYSLFGYTTIAAGSGGASNCGIPTVSSSTGDVTACSPYPKPTWQTGTGVPADSVRDLPDVSLFAADGVNYSYYPICAEDGDCEPASSGDTLQFTGVGGTSASTPTFAAMMALVNEKTGSRQGQADFVLYPMATQFPAAFHDVTVGTNTVPCNFDTTGDDNGPVNCIAVSDPLTVTDLTYGTAIEGEIGKGTTAEYNAGTGYDLASGLGTIDAYQMVTNWSSVTFKSSTMTLTPSSTSFTHGTDITISGTVTGTSGTTPTGSVALMTTSTEPLQQGQGTFALGTGGTYTSGDTVNYLPGGTYNIYGSYSGDGVNAASTSQSTPVSITVAPEASSLYFTVLNTATGSTNETAISSGTSVSYGTQLILSGEAVPTTYYTTCITAATPPVSCNTATYGYPTGTVSFSDNGNAINTASVNAEGDAEFNAPFAVGTHSVTASYSGDNSYNASTAAAITFTVAKATPAIELSSPANGQANQTTVLTIQVENTSNSSTLNNYGIGSYVPVVPPTGTLTVTGLPGATQTLTLQNGLDTSVTTVEGVATLTLPATTAAGTYTVAIAYGGDSNYVATSANGTITIGAAATGAATTTTATASATATSESAGVNVTATVSSASAAPTGTVAFTTAAVGTTNGFNVLGEVQLTPSSGTSSIATIQVNSSTLTPGANPITVQYLGVTGSFQPSSTVISVNDGPNFSMSGSAVTIATPGSGGTSTITITPSNGFTGPVTMTCSLTSAPTGATDVPTCTVSSPPSITGTAAVTATLTVGTTAATSSALRYPDSRILPIGGAIAMAALLFFGVPVKRRGWKTLLGMIVMIAIAGSMVGCGSGGVSATSPTPPTSTGGTTAGSYVVTVTGTGGGATASAAVNVTVN